MCGSASKVSPPSRHGRGRGARDWEQGSSCDKHSMPSPASAGAAGLQVSQSLLLTCPLQAPCTPALHCSPVWSEKRYAAKAGLELTASLPQPPKGGIVLFLKMMQDLWTFFLEKNW